MVAMTQERDQEPGPFRRVRLEPLFACRLVTGEVLAQCRQGLGGLPLVKLALDESELMVQNRRLMKVQADAVESFRLG